MTTSLRRGIRSTFLRLWTRAPNILIVSSFIIVIKRTEAPFIERERIFRREYRTKDTTYAAQTKRTKKIRPGQDAAQLPEKTEPEYEEKQGEFEETAGPTPRITSRHSEKSRPDAEEEQARHSEKKQAQRRGTARIQADSKDSDVPLKKNRIGL